MPYTLARRLFGLGLVGPSPSIGGLLAAAAARYGVSLDLLTAIARRESAFNPLARSSAGAVGVMQLMPATAAQYGVTDAFDPAQNIDAGAHLLSDLLRRYNGNLSLALAAYNAGPGNVAKYGGVPPFPETQNYVARITGDLSASSAAAAAPFVPYGPEVPSEALELASRPGAFLWAEDSTPAAGDWLDDFDFSGAGSPGLSSTAKVALGLAAFGVLLVGIGD